MGESMIPQTECAACLGLHQELAEARVREANLRAELKDRLVTGEVVDKVSALIAERDEARGVARKLAWCATKGAAGDPVAAQTVASNEAVQRALAYPVKP